MIKEDVSTIYLFNSDLSEILMVYHKKLQKWLPPGGHVLKHEKFEKAAIRELREEVGISKVKLIPIEFDASYKPLFDIELLEPMQNEIAIVKENVINKLHGEHVHIDHIFVSVIDKSISLKKNFHEIEEIKWTKVCDLKKMDTYKNILEVVNYVLKHLTKLHHPL